MKNRNIDSNYININSVVYILGHKMQVLIK